MPSRENCSTSAAPTAPDWTTRPVCPGKGRGTPNVAPSPIPGTARPKEFGPTRRMLPCRVASSRPESCAGVKSEVITTSDPTPRLPHSSAAATTRAAGTATTARSGASGSSATDGTHGMPSMSLPVRADRVQGASETGVADIEQDRAADRSRAVACADHRGRPGRQQGLQAGHIRLFIPAGHRVQPGAGLTQGRVARDRHGQLHHAIGVLAPHRQPRVAEHPQHRVVVRQHVGDQDLHAAGAGQRHQVLQQQRGDAMPVHAVGHRQREFRGRRIGGELVAGDPHDLIAQQAEQRHQPRTARPGIPAGPPTRPMPGWR